MALCDICNQLNCVHQKPVRPPPSLEYRNVDLYLRHLENIYRREAGSAFAVGDEVNAGKYRAAAEALKSFMGELPELSRQQMGLGAVHRTREFPCTLR